MEKKYFLERGGKYFPVSFPLQLWERGRDKYVPTKTLTLEPEVKIVRERVHSGKGNHAVCSDCGKVACSSKCQRMPPYGNEWYYGCECGNNWSEFDGG